MRVVLQGPGLDVVANQDLEVSQTLQGGQGVYQAAQQDQEVYQALQRGQEVCDQIQEGCALLLLLLQLQLLQWLQVAFSELCGYNLTIRKGLKCASGGRRRARRRNCIVSDRPIQAAPPIARAPPNSPNVTDAAGALGRNEEEIHVCTFRCPASCQVHQGYLRPTEIVVYEGFSTGFELISGILGVSTNPPPRLQV